MSTRHGGVLSKAVVILVLVALAGALAWTALANHRANGAWSFHPLDTAWWSPTAPGPAGADPFADVAHDAKRLAGQAGEALWGAGGLVERCESWWQTTKDPHVVTAPVPVGPTTPSSTGLPPVTPVPTSIRALLEQRFAASEQRFSEGIELAKRARPTVNDDATALVGRMSTLRQANTCFADVERDLSEAIPAYQALPGYDVSKLANAKQRQGFARQMQDLTRLTP